MGRFSFYCTLLKAIIFRRCAVGRRVVEHGSVSAPVGGAGRGGAGAGQVRWSREVARLTTVSLDQHQHAGHSRQVTPAFPHRTNSRFYRTIIFDSRYHL